jgi:hypothetical protein
MSFPGFTQLVGNETVFRYEVNEDAELVLKVTNPDVIVPALRQINEIWRYSSEVAHQEPSYRILLNVRKALEGANPDRTRTTDNVEQITLNY